MNTNIRQTHIAHTLIDIADALDGSFDRVVDPAIFTKLLNHVDRLDNTGRQVVGDGQIDLFEVRQAASINQFSADYIAACYTDVAADPDALAMIQVYERDLKSLIPQPSGQAPEHISESFVVTSPMTWWTKTG